MVVALPQYMLLNCRMLTLIVRRFMGKALQVLVMRTLANERLHVNTLLSCVFEIGRRRHCWMILLVERSVVAVVCLLIC